MIEALLACTTIILGYTTFNLFRKTETLVDETERLNNEASRLRDSIIFTLRKMKETDSKGGFEADDEVGTIFKELKAHIKALGEEIEE